MLLIYYASSLNSDQLNFQPADFQPSTPTLRAGAEQGEVVEIRGESILFLEAGPQRFEKAVLDLDAGVAAFTDQVVVRAGDQFIFEPATPQVGNGDYAQLAQEIKCAVNRGLVGRGVASLHSRKDIFARDVPLLRGQRFHDHKTA